MASGQCISQHGTRGSPLKSEGVEGTAKIAGQGKNPKGEGPRSGWEHGSFLPDDPVTQHPAWAPVAWPPRGPSSGQPPPGSSATHCRPPPGSAPPAPASRSSWPTWGHRPKVTAARPARGPGWGATGRPVGPLNFKNPSQAKAYMGVGSGGLGDLQVLEQEVPNLPK